MPISDIKRMVLFSVETILWRCVRSSQMSLGCVVRASYLSRAECPPTDKRPGPTRPPVFGNPQGFVIEVEGTSLFTRASRLSPLGKIISPFGIIKRLGNSWTVTTCPRVF